jgi:hypothetical protein
MGDPFYLGAMRIAKSGLIAFYIGGRSRDTAMLVLQMLRKIKAWPLGWAILNTVPIVHCSTAICLLEQGLAWRCCQMKQGNTGVCWSNTARWFPFI